MARKKDITEGKLYKLLDKLFAGYRTTRDGVLDVRRIAEDLGISAEGVYKWLRADKLPFTQAQRLIAIVNADEDDEEAIKTFPFKADISDFLPFVS